MRCIPAVVGNTVGGASQYSGTFGMVVSGAGGTLVYSRTVAPLPSVMFNVTVPEAGADR
jgi:hypothetical protein